MNFWKTQVPASCMKPYCAAFLHSHRLCSGVSAGSERWTALYTSCTWSLRCRGSIGELASPALLSVRTWKPSESVWQGVRVDMFRTWRHVFQTTLTDTSSASFNAFLKDSFFCWKTSMVCRKAWGKKTPKISLMKLKYSLWKKIKINQKRSDWVVLTLIQSALSCSELREKTQNSHNKHLNLMTL